MKVPFSPWLGSLLLLAGCASFSPDGGLDGVAALAQPRGAPAVKRIATDDDRQRIAADVAASLAQPLTSDAAVRVALLNNRSLQAAYARLGIAEANLVQAGRLRNPGFSFARLERGMEREIDRTFTLDVVGLVTMPWRLEAERGLFAAEQSRTAVEVVRVADEARRAWVEAVAAAEAARYALQVQDAAGAGADLAREMGRVGNWSRLAQAREELFLADATSQLARMRHAEVAARERLVRALGLDGAQAQALRLPERLPDLPAAPRTLRDAEQAAVDGRLDVQALRRDTESLSRSLGLARSTGLVNVLEVGYQRNSETGLPRQTGYEVSLEIPVFDFGDARTARAESAWREATHRLAETANRARSEVRESWSAYLTAYEVSRHYRETVVPLRAKVSEESLLRYNGMLIGVFELLADAREQVAAVSAAIDAQREFWIADANLEMAVSTASPGSKP